MRNHQSKTHIKKRVQYDAQRIYLFKFTPPDFCKSLTPILSTHLRNDEYGRDFVNKSTRLSHDIVSRISIPHPVMTHGDKITWE
jgi:hypothetical protein